MTEAKDGLNKLREPFGENQIGKLPKPYRKDAPKKDCQVCGGNHGMPAIHIDYVGHAAVTDRLLDTDIEWSWEPLARDADGLPKFDSNGGLWIKLTVCGMTRIGYGDAQGKRGGDAVKEAIGDAIRNASMRYGVALQLWHKGDLHRAEDAPATPSTPVVDPATAARQELLALLKEIDIEPGEAADRFASDGNGDIGKSTNVAAIRALITHYKKMAGRA